MPYVLTFNAGSSSLKVSLFDTKKLTAPVATGTIENIGQGQAVFIQKQTKASAEQTHKIPATNHAEATAHIQKWLVTLMKDVREVSGIGHRIVHGGPHYFKPVIISQKVLDDLKALSDLDPDHMPAALASLEALENAFPLATHVACFDTAFFHELPTVAQRLPIPRKFHDLGARRYGFHGLSYEFLLRDFAKNEGEAAAHGRIIMAHMGSGVSLCAIKNKKPLETTMGFTPAGGIPMSTRSGDLDPGIVNFLHRSIGQSPSQFAHMANTESGLLGVSGRTAEMYYLLQHQKTDPHAAEAVELFSYHAAKAIGSLSAVLGGVDSLVFSGGIGERSAEVRQRICANLSYLGIELDSKRNEKNNRLISRDGSPAGVHIIPTNEALLIATQTIQTIQGGSHGNG